MDQKCGLQVGIAKRNINAYKKTQSEHCVTSVRVEKLLQKIVTIIFMILVLKLNTFEFELTDMNNQAKMLVLFFGQQRTKSKSKV